MRIPQDTIMPGTESILLNKKHGQHICPDLYGRAGFQQGETRRGLPCAPGFVLTSHDVKSWRTRSGSSDQGLPMIEPGMSPDLIARERKDGGQNDGGIS
jgi:hypothetical protein